MNYKFDEVAFHDWKHDPRTMIVFSDIKNLIAEKKDMLAQEAGRDPIRDATLSGYIRALQSVLDLTHEDINEG